MNPENDNSSYKLVKLYAYLENGYLIYSIQNDLHKKNWDCYRVVFKDTEVFIHKDPNNS